MLRTRNISSVMNESTLNNPISEGKTLKKTKSNSKKRFVRPKSTVPNEFAFSKRYQQSRPLITKPVQEKVYELVDLQPSKGMNEVTFGKRKTSAPAPSSKFIRQKHHNCGLGHLEEALKE